MRAVVMSKGTHNPYCQKRIEQVVNQSLCEFKRLSIFRIDLRSPYGVIDYEDDHKVITRFLDSLKLRIKTDVKNKSLLWKRNLNVNVDYVWVREVGDINCKGLTTMLSYS
ncbi:inovirus-type Gp2 protein [Providencia sp. PROV257]|uniref:YagK/YfjJ domain-containing protein n=1 Tax=Providencia sp. PROV257 TaxID=2949945 RepID=UPI0034DF0EAD